MSNKKPKDNSFELLHQLDRKLQTSKSSRDNNQNKPKDLRPSVSESRKRRSPSPRDKGFRDSKKFKKKSSTSITPVIEIDNDIDYDIPDRSLGDFLCKLCDAHMNSEMAWETHIQGKRHLKNLKKGDLDLKYDTLDEDPQIFSEIKNASEPIVGLSHCCEYQRLEGRPIYQCFLCSANVPNGKALIEHLCTVKHMMAYLKERDTKAHELITNTELTKGMLEPIIKDLALKHWKKHGMGKMQVKKERLKPPTPSYYKPTYKDDFSHKKPRDDRRNEYTEWDKKNLDKKDSNWRRMKDTESDYYKQRSLTPPQNNHRDDYLDSPSRYYDRYQESHHDRDVSRQYSPRDNYNYSLVDPISSCDRNDSQSSSKLPFSYDKHDASLITQRTETHPISSQSPCVDIRSEDLRLLLDQKRSKEAKCETSKLESIKKLIDIFNSVPEEIFLELVRIRMDQMEKCTATISEASTSLLKSVGNTMLSIVMNRKINGMSPEMLSKFVNAVNYKTSEPEPMIKPIDISNKSSNLNDLMKLISEFKSVPVSTSTTKPFNTDLTQNYSTNPGSIHEPVFSTEISSVSQKLFSHQPNTTIFTYETKGIPGLTLSETSSASSSYQLFGQNNSASVHSSPFPHKPQDPIGSKPKNNSWPPKDYYGRY